MTSRRILLYCQHSTGIGHYIRTKALAHGLADAGHDVAVVVGGPPVPEHPWSSAIRRIVLPELRRRRGRLESPDGASVDAVFARRRTALESHLAAAFDLCVVEHFPFGKWEMRDEILELLEALKARSPRVRVVCSVRDATDRGRFDVSLDGEHSMEKVVGSTLREHFEEVWVHGDPDLFALTGHLPWLAGLELPVRYTGYVVPLGVEPPQEARAPEVVVSGGGGRDSFPVLYAAFEAWRTVSADAAFRGLRLHACAGPYVRDGELDRLRRSLPPDVTLERASSWLSERIANSSLWIGRAGYNSLVAALAGETRMILVPSARMSDQALRAEALARRRDVGVVLLPPSPGASELAAALRDRVDAGLPGHDIRLDGVRTTVAYASE